MFFEPIAPDTSAAAYVQSAEISVLTYNIKGLPWPVASGRGQAIREIGRELAGMRREGRQPDVVLIQEGFRREVAALVRESGYRFWARGPARHEGLRKLAGGGLHVLSDQPIVDVKTVPYRHCAGWDCLANKGAMLVRLAPVGLPTPIDVVNTHMNARGAAKAPPAETLAAHNGQTRELMGFIRANRTAGAPLVVGGDFNVRNAPARYYYDALERPYTVVSEFCAQPGSGCGPNPADSGAPDAAAEPWLRSQDLQAFTDGVVRVRPLGADTLFAGKARLSDHDGYLVRYRLSWSPTTKVDDRPTYRPNPGTAVKLSRMGVKVSFKR